IAGVSALTMAISAYGFSQEISHFSAAGDTAAARIAEFADGDRSPGLSSITQAAFLRDCRNAIIAQAGLDLPQAQRGALQNACSNGALAITLSNPASSLAWMTAAHAKLASGNYLAANIDLEKSYRTGPNEGWVALLRAELVELNYSRIARGLLPHHDHDLTMILTNRDRDFVAGLFVAHPESRERITTLADTLPEPDKVRFLHSVQRLMARAKQ
ncbi:MAG TPA: hypothetical protein VL133_00315, partial [Devosia sp.]|nr:hypothetical protein [Devosia sp.]